MSNESSLRIALVDDECDTSHLSPLVANLRRDGDWNVTTYKSPELLTSLDDVDLVILDFVFYDENQDELSLEDVLHQLLKWRRDSRKVPIIGMTGQSGQSNVNEAFIRSGCDALFLKKLPLTDDCFIELREKIDWLTYRKKANEKASALADRLVSKEPGFSSSELLGKRDDFPENQEISQDEYAVIFGNWPGRRAVSLNLASLLCNEAESQWSDGVTAKELLKRALVIHPEYLRVYFLLAHLFRRDGHTPADTYNRLCELCKWASVTNAVVNDFLLKFRSDGDPFPAPGRGNVEALIGQYEADLRYVDLLAHLPTKDAAAETGSPVKYLGRLPAPRLLLPIRDLQHLPSSEYSILDDLVKKGKGIRLARQCWVDGRSKQHAIEVKAEVGVAGPSIDTLNLHALLIRTLYQEKDFRPKRVCEIGCGSGFLLSGITEQYKDSLEEVYATDVNEWALLTCRHNLVSILGEEPDKPRMHFILSHSSPCVLPRDQLDVVLCNPPYLPEKKPLVARDRDPLQGQELVEQLLIEPGPAFLSLGGRIFMVISGLLDWEKIAEAITQKIDVSKYKVEADVSLPIEVPLDLLEVSGDLQWKTVHHAEKEKRIRRHADERYQLWHQLRFIRVTRIC